MIAAASIALPPVVVFGVTAEGGAEGAICWAQASPAALRAVMKVMSAAKLFITHLLIGLYQQGQCLCWILAAPIEKIARGVPGSPYWQSGCFIEGIAKGLYRYDKFMKDAKNCAYYQQIWQMDREMPSLDAKRAAA
jgi:hypothetical protein